MSLDRILIFPAWLFFRALFLAFYYPMLAIGHIQAWLAEGYRNAGT